MKIKIGDTIFESGKGQNICVMLTEAEHKQIKDMPLKLGPRYYGIYEADNARANFEADQKALEAGGTRTTKPADKDLTEVLAFIEEEIELNHAMEADFTDLRKTETVIRRLAREAGYDLPHTTD